MSEPCPVLAGHRRGTHRIVAPERTLETIGPHLKAMGITRWADVTWLDRIGMPVCCAIRPGAIFLQVSNGKGLEPVDAKVSALMESIEQYHAENPPDHLRRASKKQLEDEGCRVIEPSALPNYSPGPFFSERFQLQWTSAIDLTRGEPVWLPASAVYYCSPMLLPFTSNGLAAGNDLTEATLHALYEVLERDAIARLSAGGQTNVKTGKTHVINLAAIEDPAVCGLIEKIRRAGTELVLIRVAAAVRVHVFWAILLNNNPVSWGSPVSMGHGAHSHPGVAATRAITEAAQSRVTFIHGAREDLPEEYYSSLESHARVRDYFAALRPSGAWADLEDYSSGDLSRDYHAILDQFADSGWTVYRADLSRAPFDIPVVKVFVPGFRGLGSFFSRGFDSA